MNVKEKAKRYLVLFGFLLAFSLIFRFAVRPFLLTWGASKAETELVLPGDSLVKDAEYVATRAIDIDVRKREVYPWLVQMGNKKAGFYGFDWYNNSFKRSAEYIMEEYQNLAIGDTIKISSLFKMQVVDFKKDSFIVWQDIRHPDYATWTWVITDRGKRNTRLISRIQMKYSYGSPRLLTNLGFEIADQAFMRKTLNGVKQRAEGDIHGSFSTDIAELLFLLLPFLSIFIFLARVFKKQNFWEPLIMVAIMLTIFLVVFYIKLPLWLLVLIGFIVLLTLIGTAAEAAALKQHERAGGASPQQSAVRHR